MEPGVLDEVVDRSMLTIVDNMLENFPMPQKLVPIEWPESSPAPDVMGEMLVSATPFTICGCGNLGGISIYPLLYNLLTPYTSFAFFMNRIWRY